MFKPEKEDNQIDHARFNSESVSSRYMQLNKKKYYLASVDQNVEQLKSEQVKELTDILIQLKSQYDELIRETNRKKKETDELGKKIEMLERVEKRSKKKLEEIEEEKSNTLQIIELKKTKREEEIYTKTTLQHLIEKLKEELYMIKKNITDCEVKSKRLAKELHKEKMIEIEIKEKVNSVYSQISEQINKNLKDKSENNLVLQYYNNIISQKWSFINSADDRKEKQIKIAQEAKNDSQDKQEVEKRKVLQLCMLYNKYLRKKMEKELKDNELLEETFQKIKDITVRKFISTHRVLQI